MEHQVTNIDQATQTRNNLQNIHVASKTTVNLYKTTLSKIPNIGFEANYRLMQVISIAECSPWSILQYFDLHQSTICV